MNVQNPFVLLLGLPWARPARLSLGRTDAMWTTLLTFFNCMILAVQQTVRLEVWKPFRFCQAFPSFPFEKKDAADGYSTTITTIVAS